ncbi:LPS O-antigen chain length determinant protein WzzB [Pseudomonas mosselii]|uniref:LPS O-antigen chain length determinant protein WzzB n=1 Tax=Pseudomonas mosselii TaxID=78327 RepID=A0A7W2PYI5_9PSED|nr:Wzz/FepE/Etk N-terminal domain-containing protein [Pseudomonas mosselii]MBA6065587.1 LPS O-antigen chain length determinant protein WzzB [Pseudomonas mosselii]
MAEEHQLRSDTGLYFGVLMGRVWEQKVLVLLIAGLFVLVGGAYAMLAAPVYEAKAYLQKPSIADVAALNQGRGASDLMPRLTAKNVYDAFLGTLQSEQLRRDFFVQGYLPRLSEQKRKEDREELYAEFIRQFVFVVDRQDAGRLLMTVQADEPQQAVQLLTEYLAQAQKQAKKEILEDVRSGAVAMAASLARSISEGRENARREREDEMARLGEALKVAESVGLQKPPMIDTGLSAEVSSGMTGTLSYLRGVTALRAELENLRSRKSDDPFVPKLRQMEAGMAFYQGLEVDPSAFQIYRLDGLVEEPVTPLKPRKGLIIVLSLIGGLLVGMIVALLRVFASFAERERLSSHN